MANALVHTLAGLLMENPLLSLEIVPGNIGAYLVEPPSPGQPSKEFPFLYTDGHLGVPKKTLHHLYPLALELLNTESRKDQLDASCVILLANPAHQTAMNTRKRLIQSATLSAHAELNFSARLLPSSRPASKESILWAHRRWIFSVLYPPAMPYFEAPSPGWVCSSEDPEIPPDVIEKEFELISRCCEMYPRNYHAWSHYHFVVQCIHASLRSSHPADSPHLPLFAVEFLKLRRWIESHVSDHSAVHQFCSIISLLQSSDLPRYQSVLAPLVDGQFEHALGLVASFPSHESLWMYLRAMITLSPVNATTLAGKAISSTAALDGPFRQKFVSWVKFTEK
ncbi:hypothetical protein C8F04DRAFT_1033731 [Mycena alexandri]|uniref:Protein prenyltransferase alpha subunit repeat-containing protein 1 n=1 Tax=Mycena alexandri TaxID=1745969 RepID=A0AAD6XBD5_9AGAR|nr:hypothetical protein C8F04DRAFT_1033731 [Mycena alexandri]